jgi:very-short-patch-repair endonuclease
MLSAFDAFASRQHGILSYGDLLEFGFTPEGINRRVKAGSLVRIYHGVYRLPGAPATWEQKLWAAHKWVGEGAVFSHRSGLLLQQLAGASEHVVEMTARRKMRSPDPRLIVHWSRTDPLVGACTVHGLPVTSVPRTIVDIASVARPWNVEAALDHALRFNLVSVPAMWTELERSGGKGRKGSGVVRGLLEDRSDGAARSHSKLEIKLDRLLRTSQLPPCFRQFEVMTLVGVPADVDFAWPEVKLAVEADGYKWHSGRKQWQDDMARQNALAEVGWLVLRFSWYDVTQRPGYVIRTIREAYARRLP